MWQTCKSLYSSPANHYFLPNPEWRQTPLKPLGNTWGAFDLPESESGFEIMILIHGFIWANRKQDFESGGSYTVYDFNWINHPRYWRWRVTPFYLSKSEIRFQKKEIILRSSFKTKLVHPLNHRIIELTHSVCKVAGSCLWFWNHDLESCFWFGWIKHTPAHFQK